MFACLKFCNHSHFYCVDGLNRQHTGIHISWNFISLCLTQQYFSECTGAGGGGGSLVISFAIKGLLL